jgi:spore germination protein
MTHVSAGRPHSFDDIDSSYARNAIINLYNQNILSGTSQTSFSPVQSMTRAEFITALDRLLKLDPVGSPVSPYTDVPSNTWYYGWVQAAVQLELASGTSATTFAPAQAVTRQEAAVWIAKALKQVAGPDSARPLFKDESELAAWARSAVAAVYELGMMKGDPSGYFRPTDPITRQEAAVLLNKIVQDAHFAGELNDDSEERVVIGWKYAQTTEQYVQSVLQSNINTLSPRWFVLDGTGKATDSTDKTLIVWAKNNDKQVWPMVTNGSDQEATHLMLSNAASRNTAVNQLTAAVSQYGLDGLNIDFENVGPGDRSALSAFITQLAASLHALGKVLSMDVSPDRGTDWTDAFDYAALGKQADYMVMMGYDEHYSGSPQPGSNASLPYDQSAVTTLLKVVANKKIILALPFYNREWTLKQDGTAASSEYISLTEQNQLIKQYSLKPIWSKTLGQYVASYWKQAATHTIWLEDGRSLIAKYRLAVEHNLAGTAYWYVGGASADIWASLSNAEKYYDYSF